jgi:hypothetical protein
MVTQIQAAYTSATCLLPLGHLYYRKATVTVPRRFGNMHDIPHLPSGWEQSQTFEHLRFMNYRVNGALSICNSYKIPSAWVNAQMTRCSVE